MNNFGVYEGCACELLHLKSNTILVGRVKQYDNTLLEIKTNMNTFFLKPDNECRVTIVSSKSGDIVITGKIFKVSGDSLIFNEFKIISQSNERKYFRVFVDTKIELIRLESVDEDIFVKIIDLSLTGSKIFTDINLNIGEEVILKFDETEEPVFINCKICNQIPYGDEYYYGCQFLDLHEHDKNLLNRYIFAIDRNKKQELQA